MKQLLKNTNNNFKKETVTRGRWRPNTILNAAFKLPLKMYAWISFRAGTSQ